MIVWRRLQRWFYDPGQPVLRILTDDDPIAFYLFPPKLEDGTPLRMITVGWHDRRFWRRMGRKR